jgi:hypothetical protein
MEQKHLIGFYILLSIRDYLITYLRSKFMRKIFVFFSILLFCTLSLYLSKGLFLKEEQTTGKTKSFPKIQVLNLKELVGTKNIRSVEIPNANTIITSMDPKPDIILFSSEKTFGFHISSIYQRDEWTINEISFVDALNGFAVGDYGTILKTVDGGVNWTNLERFSEFDFYRVKFASPLVGFVAGKLGTKNENSGDDKWKIEIYKTEDGGGSWTKSYSGNNERDVFDITFVSTEVALASIDGKLLIRTEDGGKSWRRINYDGKEIRGIALAPNNTCWLVGGSGEFFKSEDFGLTWQKSLNISNLIYNYEWWSIDFDQNGNGLAVSEDGIIAFTTDNDNKWDIMPQIIKDPLRSVSVNDTVGIILGENEIYQIKF